MRWRLKKLLVIPLACALAASFNSATVSAQPAGYPVFGSIRAEYDQTGGFGVYGAATRAETDDRQGGKFQDFQANNHIYWNQRVDPNRGRQIGGAIFDKWATTDYEAGYLGYPVSREFQANRGARGNHFENGGEIYWTSTFGARIIVGKIGETWKASGYENGPYGVPTSDEYDYQGGRRQDFEFGTSIVWNPNGFPSDIENESDPSVVNCAGTDCANDDRTKINGVGTWDFTNGGNTGNRRALTEDEASGQQLEAAATEQEASIPNCDELTPENPDLGATGDGNYACYTPGQTELSNVSPSGATTSEPPSTSPSPQTPDLPEQTPGSASTTEATPTAVPEASSPAVVPDAGTPSEPTDCAPLTTTPTTTVAPTPTVTTSGAPTPTCAPIPNREGAPQDNGDNLSPSPSPTDSAAETPDPAFGFAPASLRSPARTELTPRADYDCDINDGHWRGDRQYACRKSSGGILLFSKPVGTPGRTLIGEVVVIERREVELRWNDNKWTERYSIGIVNSIDDSATTGTTMISANGGCFSISGICGVSGENTISSRAVTDGLDLNRSWTNTLNWTSGSRPTAIGRWQTSIKFKNGSTVSAPSSNSPTLRCDNDPYMRGYHGCAFYQAAPMLDYTTKTGALSQFISHVARAQQSGLPGQPDGAPLNRVYEPTITQNRSGACGSVTGPRDTVSCDEYPFASSDQGGRVGGPYSGPARTFDGCQVPLVTGMANLSSPIGNYNNRGYSVCLIPKSENNRAGTYLSWFYTKTRVLSGDKYYVKVQ